MVAFDGTGAFVYTGFPARVVVGYLPGQADADASDTGEAEANGTTIFRSADFQAWIRRAPANRASFPRRADPR